MSREENWTKNPDTKDKLIEKMVSLLRDGHRMLDEVCPRCGAILFLRKDVGLRYCPNCNIFLATPEELKKVDRSKIKIIGEVSGGEVIEFGQEKVDLEKQIERGPHAIGRGEIRKLVESKEDLDAQLKLLVRRIVDQICYLLEFEIGRLSIKDLLEILKLLLEIRGLL